jgi:hypothetical protein
VAAACPHCGAELPSGEITHFCPACGQSITVAIPVGVETPQGPPERDIGAFISAILFFLAGAFIALIGVENSPIALGVGLAMCGDVVLGYLATNGYKIDSRAPVLLRIFALLPKFVMIGVILIAWRAFEQIIGLRRPGDR